MTDEKANHYGNQEDQVCDLVHAADVSASLLEHYLDAPKDNADLIYLPANFAEKLIFAAYEVEKRAKALRDHLYPEATARG
jgi:hypothetical protein